MGETIQQKRGKTMEERQALERYQLAVKGKEKTEDEWYVQYLIDRARTILGMKKIEWEPLDK
jgi:hypothetical protein